jgi:hypothetical protein
MFTSVRHHVELTIQSTLDGIGNSLGLGLITNSGIVKPLSQKLQDAQD